MLIKFIKDLLFPIFCVKCGQEGEWLCDQCLTRERLEPITSCPLCGLKNSGELCLVCKNKSPIDGAYSFFEYIEGSALAKLIVDFKYNYTRDILLLWEKIIEKNKLNIKNLFTENNSWAVIPVPLYKKRENERGYNQSQIIAKIIADKLLFVDNKNNFLKNSLVRCRSTAQQAKLNKVERAQNVAGAFVWQGNKMPENIILVDDVFTTGATLFECGKVLKQNGAKKIWAITLARTK
jgi:ComF family protein